MNPSRRNVLQVGLGTLGGSFLPSRSDLLRCPAPGAKGGVLVVIQVRGGWDWLTMTAPADDPVYRDLRPALAIPRNLGLPMQGSDTLVWHPSLASWRALHDRGELAIVQNLGHHHPDLSHFESEAKWHTADPVGGTIHSGWLARAFEKLPGGEHPFAALTIDEQSSQAFAGHPRPAVTRLEDMALAGTPAQIALLRAHFAKRAGIGEPSLAPVAACMVASAEASEALSKIGADHVPARSYPDSRLGRDLHTCARLIVGGAPCKALFLTAPGFDTHSQQAEAGRPAFGFLAEDLRCLAEATSCFIDDMKTCRQADRVLVILYSEFGRSLHENKVLGTEHGHCGVAFALGAPVRPGIHGTFPDLARIRALGPDQMIYNMIPFDERSTDYRSLHATILERWFGISSEPILVGRFGMVDFL